MFTFSRWAQFNFLSYSRVFFLVLFSEIFSKISKIITQHSHRYIFMVPFLGTFLCILSFTREILDQPQRVTLRRVLESTKVSQKPLGQLYRASKCLRFGAIHVALLSGGQPSTPWMITRDGIVKKCTAYSVKCIFYHIRRNSRYFLENAKHSIKFENQSCCVPVYVDHVFSSLSRRSYKGGNLSLIVELLAGPLVR